MQSFKNILLSAYTTLQIGGPAKELIIVNTQTELTDIVKQAHQNQTPYLVIGGGSNLLVADEGVDFLVIKNEVLGIEVRDAAEENSQIKLVVKSGTILQELVDYSIQHGLSGLQKITGIPGTVGGAVFGNAGAYGQTISDHITEVVCFDGAKVITLTKAECDFKYRYSYFKKSIYTILEIHLELESANPLELKAEAENILEQRLKKYPIGIKCPGSFFKNIVADTLPKEILDKIPSEKITYGKIPAGNLLEEVGAKGAKLGSIEIAPYHANLFVNQGDGTAEDFYQLVKKYAEKVSEKFGIQLEPEVQLINLPKI